jgi:hypothetical protein
MAAQKRSVLLAAVAGVLLASFVLLEFTEPADAAADQLAVSGEWQSSKCQLAAVQSSWFRSVAGIAPDPH